MIDASGRAYCNNTIGFAAIGDGEWHAASQFMFAKYISHAPVAESMLLVFTAKKHAEVAPGVGTATDMFFIGPQGYGPIEPSLMLALEQAYGQMRAAQDAAKATANAAITTHLNPPMQPPQSS